MKNISVLLFALSTFLIANCGDKCDDTNCMHNGVCESGICACTERYTGANCELEILPSAVKLKSFAIQTYETKPNGEPWDDEPNEASKPDIYIKIFDENNLEFQTTEGFETPNVFQITLAFEVEITAVNKVYTLVVYDDDDDGATDEVIYEFPFQPYNEGQNFPSNLTKIYPSPNIPPTENGELIINMDYCF